MIKNVIALSKTEAEGKRFMDNDIVISIIGPGDKEVILFANENNVFRFVFSDIEPSNKKRFPHHMENECSFTIQAAKLIAALVINLSNSSKEYNLYAHCAAGVSRSGAIVKWAHTHSDMSDTMFVTVNNQIHPNEWIWQLLCYVEEYELYKTKELENIYAW